MDDYDELHKVIVVGDGQVGKTSLSVRFSTGKFEKDYIMTIGVGLMTRTLDHMGKKIKITIWDTGGQERFAGIRPIYYKGAAAALICYSIDSRLSYKNLNRWIKEVRNHCPNIPTVLVGTKNDLEEDRVIKTLRAQTKADKLNIPFFETSSKSGINVEEPFLEIIEKIHFQKNNQNIRI
jgi:small GTP-binding protein